MVSQTTPSIGIPLDSFPSRDTAPFLYDISARALKGAAAGLLVGHITSGMYGHAIDKSIGMGYVENHHGLVDKSFVDSGTYEIEVAGERVGATAQLQPFYDPKSERVKA